MNENRHQYQLGDVIRSKKPHPCGGDEWEVVRLGMDIRLRCLNCGHMLLLPRSTVDKMIKAVIKGGNAGPT